MKEKITFRMRDGHYTRKLYTVYYYDGWYAIRGGSRAHYCGDSSYLHNYGNLDDVPSNDVFELANEEFKTMGQFVKHVNEYMKD